MLLAASLPQSNCVKGFSMHPVSVFDVSRACPGDAASVRGVGARHTSQVCIRPWLCSAALSSAAGALFV